MYFMMLRKHDTIILRQAQQLVAATRLLQRINTRDAASKPYIKVYAEL